MKYLIVSIYDSAWEFSVCDSGVVHSKYDEFTEPIRKLYWDEGNASFEHNLLDKYGDKYDLIIVCEDGMIQVLKNNTKGDKNV